MAVIEKRYATALTELVAAGKVGAEELLESLDRFVAVLASSAALREVLDSPAVTWEEKRGVLEALAARLQMAPMARNLLLVVAQRGRMSRLGGIAAALRHQLLLERQGIVQTEIVSARELTAAERGAIEKELAAQVGLKLQAAYRRDENLLGGFVARVGDQVFDGSIRGRLQRLRQALTGA